MDKPNNDEIDEENNGDNESVNSVIVPNPAVNPVRPSNKWDFISFTRHNYHVTLKDDARIRYRNLIINVLCWITMALGVVVLQVGYDGERGYHTNTIATIFKLIINGISLVIIIMLIEYRFLNIKLDMRKWQKEDISFSVRSHTSMKNMAQLLVEILIVVPQPIPYVPAVDRLALLLILRLVFVVRLIRDFHPLYRKRRDLWKDARLLYCHNPDSFNTLATFRLSFKQRTGVYVAIICLLTLTYSSYAFYVADRGKDGEIWLDWVYLTIITAATVGYGDYSPKSSVGKIIAMGTAISGVILTAFLVSVISSALSPSDFQKEAGTWLRLQKQKEEREDSSAKFIQLVYRHYILHKKFPYSRYTRRVTGSIIKNNYTLIRPVKNERSFNRKCIDYVTKLRAMRKTQQWTQVTAVNPVQWQIQEMETKFNNLQLEFKKTNEKLDKLLQALSVINPAPNAVPPMPPPAVPVLAGSPSQ